MIDAAKSRSFASLRMTILCDISQTETYYPEVQDYDLREQATHFFCGCRSEPMIETPKIKSTLPSVRSVGISM